MRQCPNCGREWPDVCEQSFNIEMEGGCIACHTWEHAEHGVSPLILDGTYQKALEEVRASHTKEHSK